MCRCSTSSREGTNYLVKQNVPLFNELRHTFGVVIPGPQDTRVEQTSDEYFIEVYLVKWEVTESKN